MHDLNEGVCRYVLGFVLYTLIFEERRITINFLNSRISGFNYINDTNVVPTITEEQIKKKYLILSASEMFFLVDSLGYINWRSNTKE